MITILLAVVIVGLYWVSKTLAPEMAKPVPSRPKVVTDLSSFEITQTNEQDQRIEKLETLLAEKNQNIQDLQRELRISSVKIRNFDKVRSLLDNEIHRLREQNRIFRSELGLPTAQLKENSMAQK